MNKNDFPTYEESEEQVRRDMQCLHDEARAALNALVDALSAPTAAAELGASAPEGMSGRTVQELINELAAALGELGGSVELDGATLAELVAAAVERDLLDDYYTGAETEAALSGLGISGLEMRLENVESLLGEGGELIREHGFIMPGTELAGAASVMSTDKDNRIFAGDRLISIVAGTDGMQLVSVNVFTGEKFTAAIGSILPVSSNAVNFQPHWLDCSGEYMVFRAGTVWYLISLGTGACSQLAMGSDYVFCGAARLGNIVTAVFYRADKLYFYRRSIAGDKGDNPTITALDTCSESGSGNDRVLGVYGTDIFAVLKYNASESVLKLYAPAEMSCSAEFPTGIAGAYAVGGARIWDDECFFSLIKANGSCYPAKCGFDLSGSVRPVLIVGAKELPGSRMLAWGEGVVYAVSGTQLYILDAETLELRSTRELPAAVDAAVCGMNGAELAKLWGGSYVPAGGWLVNVEDMSARALRCGASAPSGYAVNPAAGRYFVAHSGNAWYLFDSLLRPVWGMAPADEQEDEDETVLPEPNISGFGAMSKV